MLRFEPSQPDLFAPAPSDAPVPPERAPLDELAELLAVLRAAERLPWPDLTATMEAERRAYGLARLAGAEGALLAAAIMDETERLFSAAEQEAAQAATTPYPDRFAPLSPVPETARAALPDWRDSVPAR
jgi:hypothetical protein